jgi:hypothetical protein
MIKIMQIERLNGMAMHGTDASLEAFGDDSNPIRSFG